MNPQHLYWIIPITAAISISAGYFLLGLLTSASNTDLDRERWQALCELAILYYSFETHAGIRTK